MTSKITGGETELLFTARILSKYNVGFYRCKQTGFIQTEEPYWLNEAYSSAITKLDVGLVMRNERLVDVAAPLILNHLDHNGRFLDYAGGYGLFTRLMRDRGFDFYHTDPYCQNIFAEYQDLKELPADTKFEAVTAFEVFEHLVNPRADVGNIINHSDTVFFTTELVPDSLNTDWWYFSFETGQHVSFYTKEALQCLANNLGMNYHTDGKWLHLFTKKNLGKNPFVKTPPVREPFLIRKMRKKLRRYDQARAKPLPVKESLMGLDTETAKRKISG